MKTEVDLIKTTKNRLIRVMAIEFDHYSMHSHTYTEILIVLKGSTNLTLNSKTYLLNEKDIVIINPKELHQLRSEASCIVLSAYFNVSTFLDDKQNEKIIFDLNSVDLPNNPNYETIRYFIYSIIRLNSQNNVNAYYNTRAISYSLFAQLVNNFKNDISSSKASTKEDDAITLITSYINEHYAEKLTLNQIADIFNYTESHVAKMFKKSLNKTFIQYYDTLRVNYSIDDLTLTNYSIEEISFMHGFDSSRSYVRAFKNVFECYPSEYRKRNKENKEIAISDNNKLLKEVLDIIMAKYLRYIKRKNIKETVRTTKELVTIDGLNDYKKIKNPSAMIIRLGNINFLYNSNIISELKEIQNEMKYKYIELTSIFHQTQRLYKKTANEIMLNKPMMDNIAKMIYDLKLSPYFKFKYSIFSNCPELITSFLKYFIQSSPYQFNDILISINFEHEIEYAKEEKYTYTYKIISYYKKLRGMFGNKIRFVSPSILSAEDYRTAISVDRGHNIFDYYSINYVAATNKALALDADEVKKFIEELDNISSTKLNNILLENINFTNQVNLLNDTLFKSAYQCKNIIDIWDSISAFVMNNMFDITIENFFDNNPYLGYNGYYTFNYTKKASYYANQFLSKLKDNVIKKGKNFIVTFDDDKIVILINNYLHYSELYAENEYFELTDQDRYKCFAKYTDINFIFEISGLDYQAARIKTTYINKSSGSSYDIYKEISKQNILSNDELNQMKNLCVPKFKIEIAKINKGVLKIDSTVEPLETKIIEISLS